MARTDVTPLERIQTALDHQEPDRVPVDLGCTGLSGMRVEAQDNLLRYLKADAITEERLSESERIAAPHDALLERYPVDVAGSLAVEGALVPEDDDGDERYEWRLEHAVEIEVKPNAEPTPITALRTTDMWGTRWERRADAARFRPRNAPLQGELSPGRLETYDWPDPTDERLWALAEPAEDAATLIGPFGRGLLETALLLRGRGDVNRDLATQTGPTVRLFERLVDMKIAYWEARLADIEPPTFLMERERLDLLARFPMDQKPFRDMLRPHWQRVFESLAALAPESAIFFFCRNYSYHLLEDFVELGVRVVSLQPEAATGAKPSFLKREYGDDLTFWGGGMWEKRDFLQGSREQAEDFVKATLDEFAPEGGFVWSFLPVVDADAPPGNIEAALDTLYDYGLY